MSGLVEWARAYAQRGWPVHPLKPASKLPASPHGCKDATCELVIIEAWWKRMPEANVGIATGTALDVIDIDGDEGLDSLAKAAPFGARTIEGPIAITGKGFHILVEPTGRGNYAGLLPAVDFRGRGGYIVAPPSVHPDGAGYLWDYEHDLDAPLGKAPAWLFEHVDRPKGAVGANRTPSSDGGTTYGLRALDAELGRLASAPGPSANGGGQRNHTLHRAACRMGQLIAGGELDGRHTIEALRTVALRTGLDEVEVDKTLRSGLDKGKRQPRSAPGPGVSP